MEKFRQTGTFISETKVDYLVVEDNSHNLYIIGVFGGDLLPLIDEDLEKGELSPAEKPGPWKEKNYFTQKN